MHGTKVCCTYWGLLLKTVYNQAQSINNLRWVRRDLSPEYNFHICSNSLDNKKYKRKIRKCSCVRPGSNISALWAQVPKMKMMDWAFLKSFVFTQKGFIYICSLDLVRYLKKYYFKEKMWQNFKLFIMYNCKLSKCFQFPVSGPPGWSASCSTWLHSACWQVTKRLINAHCVKIISDRVNNIL